MKVVSLGYYPRHWQRECHLHTERFQVLALHRRAGKTHLAIARLVDAALRFRLDAGLFFYLAPFLKQAKAIAWARLKLHIEPLRQAGAVEVSEAELYVRFPHNGAVIRLYGADNPDAMRGVRLDGAVLDEVGQMRAEIWYDVVRPTLADRKGWALFIGTPKGVNLFSELYSRGQTEPGWYSASYTVYDTDALPPDEIEELRREMPPTVFAREMLCDFSASGDDQLLSLSDVLRAEQRTYHETEYSHAARILGVDPARFGSDRSVIFPRQGLVAHPPMVFAGIDNMELADRVVDKMLAWGADAVFVDSGAGGGVIDRIRQLGHPCVEVAFGGKATNPRYADKRTEMWCLMADHIGSSLALPRSQTLRRDLTSPTYTYRGDSKLLESKRDILLPSPDEGDALALTYAQPVAPRSRAPVLADYALGAQQTAEYDPLQCATRS